MSRRPVQSGGPEGNALEVQIPPEKDSGRLSFPRTPGRLSKHATPLGAASLRRIETTTSSGQLLPLISRPRLDEQIEELKPFVTMTESFKRYVTPTRVGLVLLCLILSTSGVSLIPDHEFRSMISVESIAGFHACQQYCLQARDGNFTVPDWPKGARPLCEEEDGTSTVVYQECYGHKRADCQRVDGTPTSRRPLNQIIRTECQFPLVPVVWMPYATVSVFAVAILLVIQGFGPEVLLVGGAAVLAVLGVVTPREVISGLANGGVISLAVLFPISEAITETGMLEMVVGLLLGEPKTFKGALLRMMLLVAAVSAFLSNTATVSMMIPIIASWSKRLDVHPGKMLMPLSFAAQLGGCMTLLGGSQCLVAKASIPESVYSMEFFDLFPIGACNLVATALVITVLATTGLLASSDTSGEVEEVSENPGVGQADVYKVVVVVTGRKLGGLRGKTVAACGLNRLTGVKNVRRYQGMSFFGDVGLDIGDEKVLEQDDKLEVECDEFGVVSMRQHPGVSLGNAADLAKLGSARRCRFLYEASVRANSPLLDEAYDVGADRIRALWQQPQSLREALGACLISVKGPPGKTKCCVQAGSVLLVEADYRIMRSRAMDWAECFSIVSQVPDSSPPRGDLPKDFWRNILTCVGMVVLIGLVTADQVELHIGGMVFLLALLFMHALTITQLFESMKPKILSTIVGALALGTALQKVGVVSYVAKAMSLAHGSVGLSVVIYLMSVFLSMFVNNSATIAILAPMLVSITKEDPTLRLEPMVWVLVYGAGSCFTTPLGYQTNLMVMPDGQYTFGDFVKFGSVVQVCHLALTVTFVHFLSPLLL